MANGHGGRRAGAGRKPGSANRKTRELADQAAMEGINPVEYMLGVMRDPAVEPERRDRMVVAAALYIHPRLAVVDARVDNPIEVRVSRAEIAEQARREIAEAFREWEERPNGPVIEHQNSPVQNGDRSQPVAEADRPALPVPRDFARPSSFEAVPGVARRSIPRRPHPVGSGWAG
jgi:hypothetical protein